jgi:outer membrane lipoprotein-sorting protein
VTGPDVTYVEPDDNDESLVNVDFLDNDYYDLADYDVKLDNSSKVLAMHKLTGTTVQAFVQLNDEVNIFDCVLVSDDSYYIDNV